ncbi:glutathione peroxidase [Enterococcus gallinarum]|uniref:glutathione peroxidase n=1 Tax=Enterococcus gallinarum TaxID=1353 RepID=UPI0035C22063
MSIYAFQATLENGETYSLERYRGQAIIVVNTATKCGLSPQFNELEELFQRYRDQGLMVLGFPSNQFKQEVHSASEAAEACRTTYGVYFPMHQLTVINGTEADPLFQYLEEEAPGTMGKAIKWNFTKFLIDRKGHVVERFAPQTNPTKMIPSIEKVLG